MFSKDNKDNIMEERGLRRSVAALKEL